MLYLNHLINIYFNKINNLFFCNISESKIVCNDEWIIKFILINIKV